MKVRIKWMENQGARTPLTSKNRELLPNVSCFGENKYRFRPKLCIFVLSETENMFTLYLARHGETEDNVSGHLQGQAPGCLTPLGRRQMVEARARLVGVAFDAVVCSDLQRAVDSARILCPSLSPQPLPLLRERDWGELTGCAISTLKGVTAFPPSVETLEQMQSRAAACVAYLSRHYDGQTVLAVGHGLFNRFLLAALLGVSYREVPRMQNSEIRSLQVSVSAPRSSAPCPDADEATAN